MEQKKKICKGCDTLQYIFSKGMCRTCTPKKPIQRAPIKQKVYTITKQTEKNKAHRKSQSAIRNVYFDTLIPLCTHSEESSVPINGAWRGNVCHLFPKRVYKSVQGNTDNYVFLTLEEHTRFDQLLDNNNFKQLEKEFKCWKLVVERMKNLLPLITEQGKLRILFEEYLINFPN